MDLEISDERTGPVEISQVIPPDLLKRILANANPFILKGPDFEVLLQELRGKGFSVWYSRYLMHRPTVLKARANLPALELRIAMKNQIDGTWDKIPVPVLKEYFFNLSFTPH